MNKSYIFQKKVSLNDNEKLIKELQDNDNYMIENLKKRYICVGEY